MARRILILSSDTGGGHRASAQALRSAFKERFGDSVNVHIVDILSKYLPKPLNKLPKSYPFLAGDAPWLWRLLYNQTDRYPKQAHAVNRLVGRIARRIVNRVYDSFKPDLIISVHPIAQEIGLAPLIKFKKHTPFVTIVTDLTTAHTLWFNPKVDGCFLATEETKKLAQKAGMDPDKIHLIGLPIKTEFAKPKPDKIELRKQLDLDDKPTVLLMAGGDGLGSITKIATNVAKSFKGQLIIICGRNRKLEKRLKKQFWPIKVIIKGFVDNVFDWMNASDCLITKAGPGTIAEAMACGLPVLLNGFIPGQEHGNVDYVLKHGIGKFSKKPREVAKIIDKWFEKDNQELNQMAENAKKIANPSASYQIVELIARQYLSER